MEALSIQADYSSVDLDRCIGCGTCVSICPNSAIELMIKDSKNTPSKNSDTMYKKILKERIGVRGMLKTISKILIKQKI